MPTAASTVLASLADAFDLLVDDDIPSLAIGIAHRGDDTDLIVRPLRHHPADELIGFAAPDDWEAFAIVAQGQTQPWPEGHGGPQSCLAPPPGTPVRISHIVDRSGSTLTRLTDAAGNRHDMGASTEGLVPDLCRRVLALPTAPPAESPLRYWAARWLLGVIETADDRMPGPTWATVAASHPAVATIAAIDPDLAPVAADHLVTAARSLSSTQPWEELHRQWSDPDTGGHGDLGPADVAWMDVGMLARWCLSAAPELEDLLEAARATLAPPVARQVADALLAWGLVDPEGTGGQG